MCEKTEIQQKWTENIRSCVTSPLNISTPPPINPFVSMNVFRLILFDVGLFLCVRVICEQWDYVFKMALIVLTMSF